MKKRIALINQRYGKDVNGGSEQYTKELARILSMRYDVEVITTTAKDYTTWENHYPDGTEIIDGILVRRFRVDEKRNTFLMRVFGYLLRWLPFKARIFEKIWIRAQGPVSNRAVAYILNHAKDYDIYIFMTYLYYITVKALPRVAAMSILVPTAHDEESVRYQEYKDIFEKVEAVAYLTKAEKRLVEEKLGYMPKNSDVVGSGIDIPRVDIDDFRERYHINTDYVVYVGRVDTGKNCDELIAFFKKFKEVTKYKALKLVFVGNLFMDIEVGEDILSLGFVEDNDKILAIKNAKLLMMPSKYESLSLALLEGFSLGKPAIASATCDVIREHCIDSKAGLLYDDEKTFIQAMETILDDVSLYHKMSMRAMAYVKEKYSWEKTLDKFEKLIEVS